MKPDDVYEVYKKSFKGKIEEMDIEELREILRCAYKADMPKINPIPYFGEEEEITYEYSELTAICPMTGIQDLYTVKIKYVPEDYIPELKSLRFYFLAFRNLPITHELLASKIFSEFVLAVKPKKIQLTLEVAIRGGIKTTIVKEGEYRWSE